MNLTSSQIKGRRTRTPVRSDDARGPDDGAKKPARSPTQRERCFGVDFEARLMSMISEAVRSEVNRALGERAKPPVEVAARGGRGNCQLSSGLGELSQWTTSRRSEIRYCDGHAAASRFGRGRAFGPIALSKSIENLPDRQCDRDERENAPVERSDLDEITLVSSECVAAPHHFRHKMECAKKRVSQKRHTRSSQSRDS
ncbi:unnamed protein product [Trichogramma brassicae]|uniref:Uncharacterized protein n=1 Tax=Trichogramma brassicae TaxID=86971 RepID=A0A6H5I635_9HYME|nr:unnamed protein product [Trichogramma brassicae]